MSKKIKAVKNGPLVLTGISKIQTQGGQTLEIDPEHTEICRCGNSFDLPFCDGNHIIFEFDDSKDPFRVQAPVRIFKGQHITLYFNKEICSHKGTCYETLPKVFQMNTETFIDPDAGAVDAIIDICRRCPSGALSYALPDGEQTHEATDADWEVRFAKRRYGYDGPLEVKGHIPFEDEDGNVPYTDAHYALCRCGHSKNMPFCTGDHFRVKFLDERNDESL